MRNPVTDRDCDCMGMKAYINPEYIIPELSSRDKIGSIKELIDLVEARGEISDSISVFQNVLERESLETTAVGNGVAFPHARSDSIKRLILAIGRSRKGIDFLSTDAEKVYLIFLVLAPQHAITPYLKLLGFLTSVLQDKNFCSDLVRASSIDEIINIFDVVKINEA